MVHPISSKSQLGLVTFIAALGGLLFGYDTAVISGAIGHLEQYFQLTSAEVGWAASCALIGCAFGAALAGALSHHFGRKKALLFSAVCFSISAIGSAMPESFSVFIFYRMLGGVGVGVASMLSPMYIAEIAPAHKRGQLVSFYQFAIVIGILVVYFVNYYISGAGDAGWNQNLGWRWMLGSEIIPAILFFALLPIVPESPRWLAMKGQYKKAESVLQTLHGRATASKEIREIKASLQQNLRESSSGFTELLSQPSRLILFVGLCLSIFQQITGINVFMYYAPEIFKDFGSGDRAALFQTILIGSVNLLATIFAIYAVDRLGRKQLMVWGSVGMGACLTAIGAAAYSGSVGSWLVVFVLGYIACFAFSLGPVVWVLLTEIFPNQIRSKALAITVGAHWMANYLVSQTFPMMMGSDFLNGKFHGAFPFWLYASMCLLTVIFTLYFVPETKGQQLEKIEKHWNKLAQQES